MPMTPTPCRCEMILVRSGQTLASNQSVSSYPKDGVLCFSLSSTQSAGRGCSDSSTLACVVAGQTVGTSEIRALVSAHVKDGVYPVSSLQPTVYAMRYLAWYL